LPSTVFVTEGFEVSSGFFVTLFRFGFGSFTPWSLVLFGATTFTGLAACVSKI